MNIKDSYLHSDTPVIKSISVNADKLTYTLADKTESTKTITLPLATTSANGLLSAIDKSKLNKLNSDYFNDIVTYEIYPLDNGGRSTYILIAELPKWVDGSADTYYFIGRLVSARGGNKANTGVFNIVAMATSYKGDPWNLDHMLYVDTYSKARVLEPYIVSYNNKNYLALKKTGSSTYIYFEGIVRNILPQNEWIELNVEANETLPFGMTIVRSPNYSDLYSITTCKYFDGTYNRTLLHNGNLNFTTSGKNYAVNLSDNKLYVYVPWTDTKNTAGSTNSENKLFLIGTTSQNTSPQTYSNSKVYATNGLLTADGFSGPIKGETLLNVNTGYKDLYFKFFNNVSGCASTVSTDGKRYAGTANSYGFPVSDNANSMLWLGAYSGPYGDQLGFSGKGIFHRRINNNTFPTNVNGGSWKQLAYKSDIPTSLKSPGTLTFSAGAFEAKTYDGSEDTSVNIPSRFDLIADANSISVDVDSITRKTIVRTIKTGEGYISRAALGLKNKSTAFASVVIGVGTNDAGTTFTDYYFSPDGSITDSKGNTYAKLTDLVDEKVKLEETTSNALYEILLSGNANSNTETTTSKKSSKLKFNPNTGTLSSTYIYTKGLKGQAESLEDLMKSGLALAYTRCSKPSFSNETGITVSGNANGILWVGTHGPEASNTSDIGYGHMLGFVGGNGALYHKIVANGDTTKAWKQIAYTSSDITGNAASADKLKTAIKIWGLDFDGSANVSGSLTEVTSIHMNGDIVINDGTNNDRYIKFQYNNTDAYAWRVGYTGSQHGENNDFVIQTTGADGSNTTFNNVLQLKPNKNAIFSASVTATSFIGNLDWSNLLNVPASFTPSAHNHSELTWSKDTRDEATIPSDYKFKFKFVGIKTPSIIGITESGVGWTSLIGWQGYSDNSGPKSWELASGNNDKIYVRSGRGKFNSVTGTENWGAWNTIAYTTTNFPSNQIDKLTGYTKANAVSSIEASDSLNTALGKLEYKTDFICNDLFGTDNDEVINKWDEIVDFIDSVKETETDILDTFVTRKTELKVIGKKTFTNSLGTIFKYGNYGVRLVGNSEYGYLQLGQTDGEGTKTHKGKITGINATTLNSLDVVSTTTNFSGYVTATRTLTVKTDGSNQTPRLEFSEFYQDDENWTSSIISDYFGKNVCTTTGFTHGLYIKLGRETFNNLNILDNVGNPIARISKDMGHLFDGCTTLQSKVDGVGVSLILKNAEWKANMSTAMDFHNGALYTVPQARIETKMDGSGKAGGTLIFSTLQKHDSTNPNPNDLVERFRISDNGTATFKCNVNIRNAGGNALSGMTNASLMYDSYTSLNSTSYHPILGVKTNGGNVVNLGAYVNGVGFYGYKSGRTENNWDWKFVFDSATGNVTSTSSITVAKLAINGGTSSQFLKADGSVDTNTYVTTNTNQDITGLKTFKNLTKIVAAGNHALTLRTTPSTTAEEPQKWVSLGMLWDEYTKDDSGKVTKTTTHSGYFVYKGGTNYRLTDEGWSKDYAILHAGNSSISDGVITINGSSITPITSNSLSTVLSNYVTIDGEQTISGKKSFSTETYVHSIASNGFKYGVRLLGHGLAGYLQLGQITSGETKSHVGHITGIGGSALASLNISSNTTSFTGNITTKSNIEATGTITATGGFIGNLTGNADTATTAGCIPLVKITKESEIVLDANIRGYFGSGDSYDATEGNFTSLKYSALLSVGYPDRGFRLWISRYETDVAPGFHYTVGKSETNPAWVTERVLLDTYNFNSYVPKLDGTGANGTWNISITGNSNSAVTAGSLKSTAIKESLTKKLSNKNWVDTGYTFTDLPTGTYAIQVTSGSELVASGIMSVCKNLVDTIGDEIPLHVYGTANWRPYLRTHQNKLEISSTDDKETSRTVTIKIAQIL